MTFSDLIRIHQSQTRADARRVHRAPAPKPATPVISDWASI